MFNQEHQNNFKQNPNSWKFCFDIETKKGEVIRLNDSSKIIKHQEKTYFPKSGFEFISSIFDDSGNAEIRLKGFFEKNGIENEEQLIDSKISISIYLTDKDIMQKWVCYDVSDISRNTNSYELRLTPISKNYESTLVEFYSTSCRANFGDKRCGLASSVTEGNSCDKSFRMCCKKYNNAVNFRGEPFIPTIGYFNNYD